MRKYFQLYKSTGWYPKLFVFKLSKYQKIKKISTFVRRIFAQWIINKVISLKSTRSRGVQSVKYFWWFKILRNGNRCENENTAENIRSKQIGIITLIAKFQHKSRTLRLKNDHNIHTIILRNGRNSENTCAMVYVYYCKFSFLPPKCPHFIYKKP